MEEEGLCVGEDGLEDAEERLLDLVLEVESEVDRQIVLKDIERVLTLLVALGAFRSLYHYIGHSIAH